MDTLCSLLGLPPEAAPDLRRWTTALVDGLDPWADGAAADRAAGPSTRSSPPGARVEACRADPRDHLMSVLATAPDLTPEEQLHNTVLFLNAGLDTSGDLLANAVARLLEMPGARDASRRRPLGSSAPVGEEVARYDSPVQFSMRRTVDPVEVAGSSVPPDVRCCSGWALPTAIPSVRRPRHVRRRPGRPPPPRVRRWRPPVPGRPGRPAGGGGDPLRLARRFPTLRLAGEAPWRPRLAFRVAPRCRSRSRAGAERSSVSPAAWGAPIAGRVEVRQSPPAQRAARPRRTARSRPLRVSDGGPLEPRRASARRPSWSSRSPRTAGSRW